MKKWLLLCLGNPNTNLIADLLHCTWRIDFFSSKYDNFIVLDDIFLHFWNDFVEHTIYKASFKETACFKSVDSPTCVDLILTNQNDSKNEEGFSERTGRLTAADPNKRRNRIY